MNLRERLARGRASYGAAYICLLSPPVDQRLAPPEGWSSNNGLRRPHADSAPVVRPRQLHAMPHPGGTREAASTGAEAAIPVAAGYASGLAGLRAVRKVT